MSVCLTHALLLTAHCTISCLTAQAWAAFVRSKYNVPARLCRWCGKMAVLFSLMAVQMAEDVQADVLGSARIVLCTVASTGRFIRDWQEQRPDDPLVVHTVIVDECGCTPESSTALLLKLEPTNLILVGDHKQLPPCSMLPPQELVGTGHSRSLLERCVLSSGTVHRLAEQYRMPAPICRVVSKLFYRNLLTTPGPLAQVRACMRPSPPPMIW